MTAPGDNRLPALAETIRTVHGSALAHATTAAENAIAAGRALIEAKGLVTHGEWRQWLADHTGLSERTAQRYAQLARSGLKAATVADLGIRGAAEAIARSGAATVYAHGSKVAFVWPSQHAGFRSFAVVDLDTGVVTELPRGVRADCLAVAMGHAGFDIDAAGDGQDLDAAEWRGLADGLGEVAV